jgi:hypothetical protein
LRLLSSRERQGGSLLRREVVCAHIHYPYWLRNQATAMEVDHDRNLHGNLPSAGGGGGGEGIVGAGTVTGTLELLSFGWVERSDAERANAAAAHTAASVSQLRELLELVAAETQKRIAGTKAVGGPLSQCHSRLAHACPFNLPPATPARVSFQLSTPDLLAIVSLQSFTPALLARDSFQASSPASLTRVCLQPSTPALLAHIFIFSYSLHSCLRLQNSGMFMLLRRHAFRALRAGRWPQLTSRLPADVGWNTLGYN